MIVYKIKDSKIVGVSRKDADYELQENEYSSNTWHQKPFFNGIEVVESITQQEIDAQADLKADEDDAREIYNMEKQGIEVSKRLKRKVYQTIKELTLSDAKLDTIEDFERDIYKWLANGRLRRAKRTLPINRPNGELGLIWDIFNNELN